MNPSDWPAYLIPMLAAAAAGGVIGLEREWRGRAAGFRTHILVSLASALLMQLAIRQGEWAFELLPGERLQADPVRMAHGVLTGIGFLCAGVIFRTGFSIHGLTTAASVWITSAIGMTLGAGLYGMGGSATVMTLLILLALRLVSARMVEHALVDVSVSWRRDGEDRDRAIEAVLAQAGGEPSVDRIELCDDGRVMKRSWRIRARQKGQLTELARRLAAMEEVVAFKLDPREN